MGFKAAVLLGLLWAAGMIVSTIAASDTSDSYKVVHGWPILPDGFIFGQVSGVGVDSHNRVFVYHRADVPWIDKLNEHPIEPPVIMSFDGATGKLLGSWGANFFLNPHQLAVDREDNI